VRKASKRSFTKAKQTKFLSVLADTCNVSEAARRAGVSPNCVYQKRKTDAAFRAGWMDAIATAYQRLELVLLERAFNGTEKIVRRKDGSEERMREYSNQLGLTLLKMHRATAVQANSELPAADIEEVRERLVKKFERLQKRLDSEDAARG
jgi:hypothetical protein